MSFLDAHAPGRQLVGFEHRLKARDRIEEKVIHDMRKRGVSAERSFSALTDTLRYTFQYPEDGYADAIAADVARMKSEGFELAGLRNMWAEPSPGCKGINSVWRAADAAGGQQLFEVQFHTEASYAARQETYPAYSRLRTLKCGDAEIRELRAHQCFVTGEVPVPDGELDLLTGMHTGCPRPPAPRTEATPTTYYAIVDDFSTLDEPGGVLRRVAADDGEYDEEFGTDLEWTRSWSLYSWERANMDADFFAVSENEASQVVERIRRAAIPFNRDSAEHRRRRNK
jgi:hypothetical protein